MPAISLGFEEVEERLRQIRRRLNSLSLQHIAYSSGSLIVVLGALLLVARWRASPQIVRSFMAAYTAVVCLIVGFATIRLRSRWLSLEKVARLADREAALDSRLATLYGQRSRPQRSRLGGILLAQTLALGPRWDRSALAPRRVPRSAYILLASLALLGATSFVPPKQIDPAIAGGTSPGAPDDASETSGGESVNTNVPAMLASKGNEGKTAGGAGLSRYEAASESAGARSELDDLDDLAKDRTSGQATTRGLAGLSEESEVPPANVDIRRDQSEPGARFGETNRSAPRQDHGEKRADQNTFETDPNTARTERPAKHDSKPNKKGENDRIRPETESESVDSSLAKGGAKPSGKTGTTMNGSLFDGGELQATQPANTAEPGTFALRLTGVSASSPTSLEPQNKRPEETGPGFGLGNGSSQTGVAEHQVEDEPLQKDLISAEHESLVQRIFRHE